MKTEFAAKQVNIGPLYSDGIFQGKDLYPYYFCNQRIGYKKTCQDNEQPGAFIIDDAFYHALKFTEEEIPYLHREHNNIKISDPGGFYPFCFCKKNNKGQYKNKIDKNSTISKNSDDALHGR